MDMYLTGYELYEYDSNGNQVKRTDYDGNDNYLRTLTFEYSTPNDGVSAVKTTVAEVDSEDLFIYENYTDSTGFNFKIINYNEDDSISDYSIYEKNGNKETARYYDSDDTIYDIGVYTFDSNGNCVESLYYNDEELTDLNRESTYTFYENGLWKTDTYIYYYKGEDELKDTGDDYIVKEVYSYEKYDAYDDVLEMIYSHYVDDTLKEQTKTTYIYNADLTVKTETKVDLLENN